MRDYLKDKYLVNDWESRLEEARNKIYRSLDGFPDFLGIDFCDVGAGGIQIRGHHNIITLRYGHTYPVQQPIVKYDFSNLDEAANDFIAIWKKENEKEKLESYIRMYEDMKKYGTD